MSTPSETLAVVQARERWEERLGRDEAGESMR